MSSGTLNLGYFILAPRKFLSSSPKHAFEINAQGHVRGNILPIDSNGQYVSLFFFCMKEKYSCFHSFSFWSLELEMKYLCAEMIYFAHLEFVKCIRLKRDAMFRFSGARERIVSFLYAAFMDYWSCVSNLQSKGKMLSFKLLTCQNLFVHISTLKIANSLLVTESFYT